jgi:uncharacterized protein (DUF427 family)
MRTARATWNGVTLAESDRVVIVVILEGNAYFPPEAVNHEHLVDSPSHTVCPWKGMAHYYTVVAGGEINPDAAWFYPNPSPLARKIKGHVAFWHGVRVETLDPDRGRAMPGSRLLARLLSRTS